MTIANDKIAIIPQYELNFHSISTQFHVEVDRLLQYLINVSLVTQSLLEYTINLDDSTVPRCNSISTRFQLDRMLVRISNL